MYKQKIQLIFNQSAISQFRTRKTMLDYTEQLLYLGKVASKYKFTLHLIIGWTL